MLVTAAMALKAALRTSCEHPGFTIVLTWKLYRRIEMTHENKILDLPTSPKRKLEQDNTMEINLANETWNLTKSNHNVN